MGGVPAATPGVDVYVARQPIYTAALSVSAYELLFRDGTGNRAAISDPEAATSTVILNACGEIGLERLVGAQPAWINVTQRFLMSNASVPIAPERVVLEILEDAVAEPDFLRVLRTTWAPRYTLALDDFVLSPGNEPLLDLASVVKLDVLAMDRDSLARHLDLLRAREIVPLAEKVEDYETFEWCRAAGFELFQGYFFCEPRTITARSVAAGGIGRFRLLAALQDPDVGFEELERLIMQDVGLSFRLLRFINSAYFGLARTVSSVHDAFVLLGRENVRRWATVMLLAASPGKPHELMVTALVRARMCELLAADTGENQRALFTAGLFSVVDALLDQAMAEILEGLPFSGEVKMALLARAGGIGRILESVVAYERGRPGDIHPAVGGAARVEAAYLESLAWATETAAGLA